MTEGITYLDGFSGYGGFYMGLKAAGVKFKKVYFSEIDKHAIANYSYNFPTHEHVGSITDVSKATVGNIDLFTFGWPCQDNSIAGKRKGQSGGTRSSLLFEAGRILNECQPRNFIAENVAGLFSVNGGIDFMQSLDFLAYLNQSCPQYDIEMQLLNTRWVLPQNRERLFFVGHLRGSGSRQIFPIGQEDCGTTERTGNAPTVRCLTAGGHSGGLHSSMTLVKSATVSGFEVATEGDSINFSVPGSKTRRGRVGKGVAQTLDTACNQAVICGTLRPGEKGEGLRVGDSNCAPTLTTKNDESTSGTIVVGNIDRLFTMGGTKPNRSCLGASRTPECGNEQGSIRRLTPIETERLQGLPDNHTKYGIYKGRPTRADLLLREQQPELWAYHSKMVDPDNVALREISDTQRYKLCGNGVSVPIITLIGKKLFRA